CPVEIAGVHRDPRAEAIASLLGTALRSRAEELGIAASMIANREQIDLLVAWYLRGRRGTPPQVARPGGWQYAAAGEMLLSLLEGRSSLVVDLHSRCGVSVKAEGTPLASPPLGAAAKGGAPGTHTA
ncbi:MAG: hypothetical protein QHJ73_17795, partial [Armatimonadota bacterium]|nr:hypothetical protein [Armatimonadota bacterium]